MARIASRIDGPKLGRLSRNNCSKATAPRASDGAGAFVAAEEEEGVALDELVVSPASVAASERSSNHRASTMDSGTVEAGVSVPPTISCATASIASRDSSTEGSYANSVADKTRHASLLLLAVESIVCKAAFT